MQGIILPLLAFCLLCLALACYHRRHRNSTGRRVKSKVVGITGTIASGKSLVGKLLEEANVPVLDTDHIAHSVQANDVEVRAALRARFGDGIFSENGAVDRKKLGRIVFDDASALKDLNAIIHPAIRRECNKQIEALSAHPMVAVLVPLLFEAGMEKQYDEIWTVTASDEVVIARLKARDGISDEDAMKRIRSQFSQAEKVRRSHHVIDNSGTVEETRKQVLALLH